MTQASPLQWPAGKPRCLYPSSSRFGERSLEEARKILMREIRLLDGTDFILSTNLRLRQDGYPYSDQRQPDDQGAAVYFKYQGKQMCFACDQWAKIQENIYAIAKSIEALRGIERWGSGDMMQQAFTGFVALPGQRSAWEILGIKPGTVDDIEAAYRKKAKTCHPDKGGTQELMWELNDARARALNLIA